MLTPFQNGATVAEDVSPAGEGQVAGHDQRRMFITGRHQLEEQIGGILVEGNIANFIHQQRSVTAYGMASRFALSCWLDFCLKAETDEVHMPLPEPTRTEATEYARNDLPGDVAWHTKYFDFISDSELRQRIGQEYYAARFLYKLWESLRIDETWAAQAQIQLQVQQYASIYEACLHHLLFVEAADAPEVQRLFEYRALVERPLPGHIMDRVRALAVDDASQIVGAVHKVRRTQESKVRFDSKVAAAVALGILDDALGREIVGFYTARNFIHIHAELRQADLEWQISFARDAYRRLMPFKAQVSAWRAARAVG